MKRFLLIFLVLIFASFAAPVGAIPPATLGVLGGPVVSGEAPTTAFCSSCIGTADADIFCSSFEGNGCLSASFTLGTVDGIWGESSTPGDISTCADDGTHALHITVSAGSQKSYKYYDNVDSVASQKVLFYIWIQSHSLDSAGENVGIMKSANSTSFSNYAYYFDLRRNSDTKLTIRLTHRNESSGYTVITSDVDISSALQQWHKIEAVLINGSTPTLTVDGTQTTSADNYDNENSNNYLALGIINNSSDAADYYLDNIKINTGDMPSCN